MYLLTHNSQTNYELQHLWAPYKKKRTGFVSKQGSITTQQLRLFCLTTAYTAAAGASILYIDDDKRKSRQSQRSLLLLLLAQSNKHDSDSSSPNVGNAKMNAEFPQYTNNIC
jgi:hypothetical protein